MTPASVKPGTAIAIAVEAASLVAIGVIVFATAYAFARRALVSLVYGVAILAVYALEVASAGGPFVLASPVLGDLGLRFGPGVWPAPWTWITFEFVHGSETHVLLNLLGLILISPGFEERIGGVRWAVLFFAGGAFGAVVFLAVHAGASTVLVGASAGILAAFGAYGRLFPRERVTLFLPIPGVPSLPIAQVVLGYLILEMALSLFGARGIAWEAHVGGIAFGFGAAPAVMRLPSPGRRAVRLRPIEGLRDLATTPELQRILEEAERADLPETRDAWIEKFVAGARCPRCGGSLRRRFGRIASPCGWRRTI